jgi:hypothetical protein
MSYYICVRCTARHLDDLMDHAWPVSPEKGEPYNGMSDETFGEIKAVLRDMMDADPPQR